MTDAQAVAAFLDKELQIEAFDDSSHNGLQVANTGKVTRVCCGVDACMAFFEAAQARGASLVICHHGMSWGDSLKRITDLNYIRLAYLIRNNMALYACHLPLDAHPRHGNNAGLAKALGLVRLKPFGEYHGKRIGFCGELPRAMRYDRFKRLAERVTGGVLQTMDFGPKTVRTVAVVSGAAADLVDEAGREGIDVYLSGEPSLVAYSLAQEYHVNAVFAGHYATETFGVRSLASLIKRKFGLSAEFIDLAVPY